MKIFTKYLFLCLPVISGILWGSAGVFVRQLTTFGMDNFSILGTRMVVAAAMMFAALWLYNRSLLRILPRDLWLFLGCGLLGILGLNFFYNEAVGEVTLSLAAILLSLAPVFVMLLSSVIFKEKITQRKVGCMLLALVGCVLASGILDAGVSVHWSLRGIFMGLLSAFFCALYGIFSKLATDRGYHIFTVLFYSLLSIAIALAAVTDWKLFGAFLEASLAANTLFALAHSACTSILPYAFYSIALIYMENSTVSILAGGGEPMAAVVFGVLFFAEIPTVLNLVGIGITILALTLLCRPSQKEATIDTCEAVPAADHPAS